MSACSGVWSKTILSRFLILGPFPKHVNNKMYCKCVAKTLKDSADITLKLKINTQKHVLKFCKKVQRLAKCVKKNSIFFGKMHKFEPKNEKPKKIAQLERN